MGAPKGHKYYGGAPPKITEDTPLTASDWKFVYAYIRAETETLNVIGRASSDKVRAGSGYKMHTANMLKKPNIRKVINELMEEKTRKTIAESAEVMEYFTSVMRGEVKDQFGLDAPLTERTNAAKELAKRTVDVDLRKQGMADNQITVTLNWGEKDE